MHDKWDRGFVEDRKPIENLEFKFFNARVGSEVAFFRPDSRRMDNEYAKHCRVQEGSMRRVPSSQGFLSCRYLVGRFRAASHYDTCFSLNGSFSSSSRRWVAHVG